MSFLRDMQKFKQNRNVDQRSAQKNCQKRSQSSGNIYPNKYVHQFSPFGIKDEAFDKKIINQPAMLSSPIKRRASFKQQATLKYSSTFELKQKPNKYNKAKQANEQLSDIISRKMGFNYNTEKNEKFCMTKDAEENRNEDEFDRLFAIGKGGFGKVWKIREKSNGKFYAMKEMEKVKIYERKSIDMVMNQLKFLSSLSHPFIINMHCAFQSQKNLFLVMDYLDGGDLRYHMKKRVKFQQSEAKFLVANILVGLKYLREKNIVHRDLKPQNLVFDAMGYLRITDLGISRLCEPNLVDTSGTPGYMAPQTLNARSHTYSSDYFALGVITYELMLNKRPYYGLDFREMRENMSKKQMIIKMQDLPYKWSPQALDFINSLLRHNPETRLGSQNFTDLLSHPWLSQIDWTQLQNKQITAPFIPRSIEDYYELYKLEISNDTKLDFIEQNNKLLILQDTSIQKKFLNYKFNRQKQTPKFSHAHHHSALRNPFCVESV